MKLNRTVGYPLCLTLALFSSCASQPKSGETSSNRSADKESVLTRDEAMYRAQQVQKVKYQLWFVVDSTNEDFGGRSSIQFELRDRAWAHRSDLRVDFTGAKIESIVVNGKSWDKDEIARRYDGEKIRFKSDELKPGANRIDINYNHAYSKTGNGFYRFKDPEDGKVYLYTNLEPFYANLVFPCFDQPDVKAYYDVTVEAPEEFKVIANMPERDVAGVDGRQSHQFQTSPLMSSYLFAIAAGPFKEWKSNAAGIPLKLYARKSLAKFVDADEWFRITQKGLAFYSEYFDYPYPFAKYDQILVPDFVPGAMENIGAVTFNERMVFRGKTTEEQKMGRAETILHEMAHMWFGDLVTMRWWNGLWLNESFATYLSAIATDRTKLFPGVWESFFSGTKQWAYTEDQLPTRHPIEVSVLDTATAFSNFDGITYGKGASALKQLHFLIGDEDFKEGLHRYFTKFAHRNTTLADLMATFSQASEQDLSIWQKLWLQSEGHSRISVQVSCAEGKINDFVVKQSVSGEKNVLRPHRMKIGLYKASGDRITRIDEPLNAFIDGETATIDTAIDVKCPDLIIPNEEDHDFAMLDLDPKSIETLKDKLSNVSDKFTRMTLWFTAWEMVKAGTLSPQDYAELLLKHLEPEKDKQIIQAVTRTARSNRSNSITVARLLTGEKRAKFEKDWLELTDRRLKRSSAGSEMQLIWLRSKLTALYDVAGAEWARSLFHKKTKLPGLVIDPDLGWEILYPVARILGLSADDVSAATAMDSSSQGKKELFALQSAAPSEPVVQSTSELLTLKKKDEMASPSVLRNSMRSFLNAWDDQRTKTWSVTYFKELEEISKTSDDTYASSFGERLYPGLCNEESVKAGKSWLMDHPRVTTSVLKGYKKAVYFDEWCSSLRAAKGQPPYNGYR